MPRTITIRLYIPYYNGVVIGISKHKMKFI